MMNTPFRTLTAGAVLALLAGIALPARGDPLKGETLKFQQKPLDGLSITSPDGVVQDYWGHDEYSTAQGTIDPATGEAIYQGRFMADDFADQVDRPVAHLKWWGSYINGVGEPDADAAGGVKKFLVAFEEDAVVSPNLFSRPGKPLLSQIVTMGPLAPGSGTFTEKLMPGYPVAAAVENLYEYNAELSLPFDQAPDTVYWLKIVALDDTDDTTQPVRWGWHNRDYTVMDPLASVPPAVIPGEWQVGELPDEQPIWHFQDDAVSGAIIVMDPSPGESNDEVLEQYDFAPARYVDGLDGPGPIPGADFPGIGRFSKDLAFELYAAVPEPSTLLLSAIAVMGLAIVVRRR